MTPSTRNEGINRDNTLTPKRIVTRVRALGLAHSRNSIVDSNDFDNFTSDTVRHKITITRRRKLERTIDTVTPRRVRITRKKLIAVRPIEPTPTLAIITTGFFTAPSDYSDEYEEEDNTEDEDTEEDIEDDDHPITTTTTTTITTSTTTTVTPSLEVTPDDIESNPDEELIEFKTPVLDVTSVYEVPEPMPVIITDNFFFPPTEDEDEDEDENYDDDNYTETTTSDDLSSIGDISDPSNERNDTVKDDTRLEDVDDDDTTTVITDVDEEDHANPDKEFVTLDEDLKSNRDTDIDVSVNTATLSSILTTTESIDIVDDDDGNELAISDSTDETSSDIVEITTALPEEETTTPIEEEDTSSLRENETTPVSDEETTVIKEVETTPMKEEDVTSLREKEKLSIETNDLTKEMNLTDIFVSDDKINITTISEESVEQTTMISDVIEQPVTTISKTIDTNVERNSVTTSTDDAIEDFDSTSDIGASMNDFTNIDQTPNSEEERREDNEILTVKPIESHDEFEIPSILVTEKTSDTILDNLSESKVPYTGTIVTSNPTISSNFDTNSYIPSVIPLDRDYTTSNKPDLRIDATNVLTLNLTKTVPSSKPENVEAGPSDDLYLSFTSPYLPEIVKSNSKTIDIESKKSMSQNIPLEPSTSIYYTETIVTSTRLRTYTYIVTKLNGLETQVTSSTTIKPKVTTLTLTMPITVTVTPTMESSVNAHSSMCNTVTVFGE